MANKTLSTTLKTAVASAGLIVARVGTEQFSCSTVSGTDSKLKLGIQSVPCVRFKGLTALKNSNVMCVMTRLSSSDASDWSADAHGIDTTYKVRL